MMRRLAFCLWLLPAAAAANGRMAGTSSLAFRPGDNQEILLATTFGLLLSTDDGKSFRWSCEETVGYSGNFDPAYAITAQGTIIAGVYDHLAVSRDGGCSYAPLLVGTWIADVTVGPDGTIWVGTANAAVLNDVLVSTDDGRSFVPAHVPETMAFWKTVRAAPSDGRRVYVSGYKAVRDADAAAGSAGIIWRTDDAGAHWQPLGGDFGSAEVRIFGVSPTNRDVVLVHLAAGTSETLFRTDDAGAHWTPVLAPAAQLESFATEADGQHMLVGSSQANGGVWTSDDAGVTWTPATQQPKAICAGVRADGTIFACGSNWTPDFFALARSADHGQTYSKVFRFSEMSGPLACPVGTKQKDVCEPAWPGIAAQFAVPLPETPDAPVTVTPPAKSSGCGCGVSPALILVLGLSRRRRWSATWS